MHSVKSNGTGYRFTGNRFIEAFVDNTAFRRNVEIKTHLVVLDIRSCIRLFGQRLGQSDVGLWTSEVADASTSMGADLARRVLEPSCLISCGPCVYSAYSTSSSSSPPPTSASSARTCTLSGKGGGLHGNCGRALRPGVWLGPQLLAPHPG